uniref:Calcium homeostasis endoplasmic reticulum protein n=2 Tax=Dendroctonus ponderosae TaxID=77166 RepID=A0AAR5QEN0_DENPD
MDIPQPPEDIDLRNIIDKLAQFVARNGLEFEQMTKNKQKGNPKFQFLYGGEYFKYYQYKVSTEQAIFKQQQQLISIPPPTQIAVTEPNTWTASPVHLTAQQTIEIDHIIQQQDTLREQIKQSEQNLSAQHNVLMQQQQAAIEGAVAKCEAADLQREADDCGIVLTELNSILQPIIESCTKDSISNGKSWFLQHASTKQKSSCIVQCLLYRVLQSSTFPQKLHVIYLVNDLLHHSARKNACDLKDALELAVVPMFCNASIAATEEQKLKLDKLVKLWESKANYLKSDTLEKLHNPIKSYQQYQSDQMAKYATEVASIADQTKITFEGYQSQHQAFVCHAMQQIMDLQQQRQTIEQQKPHIPLSEPPVTTQAQNSGIIPLETIQASLQQTIQSLSQSNMSNLNQQPPQQTFPIQAIGSQNSIMPEENFLQVNLNVPPPNMAVLPNIPPTITSNPLLEIQPPPNGIDTSAIFSLPPPGYLPPVGMFPDFSKPPPGFPPKPEVFLEDLMPTAPYYELPAGLMVPLVKLEDSEYKPLDPKDIRLPPPAPPSDRLLAAVDAFYSLPSHERPRDSEGWEKLGLYEYYKAKNHAKREKDEAIKAGIRQKSRSPSPIVVKPEKDETPPKRRYRSKSPTPPPSSHRRSSRKKRSRSRSRSKSRSRSRSPRKRRGRELRESREIKRRRSVSRSRSKSKSPLRRSMSPTPGFGNMPYLRAEAQELDPSNKGHEMLRKMGWGGKGLGANEQGIDAPISGGDVRDRQDQFKGVGCNLNDPYENFRKNKGAAFITRMKARAEEREKESKNHFNCVFIKSILKSVLRWAFQ